MAALERPGSLDSSQLEEPALLERHDVDLLDERRRGEQVAHSARQLRPEPAARGHLDLREVEVIMNTSSALDRFLQADPRDVGCEEAMELLHAYVDLLIADPAAATERYPGIAAHLRACGPCSEDFEGLLASVAGSAS